MSRDRVPDQLEHEKDLTNSLNIAGLMPAKAVSSGGNLQYCGEFKSWKKFLDQKNLKKEALIKISKELLQTSILRNNFSEANGYVFISMHLIEKLSKHYTDLQASPHIGNIQTHTTSEVSAVLEESGEFLTNTEIKEIITIGRKDHLMGITPSHIQVWYCQILGTKGDLIPRSEKDTLTKWIQEERHTLLSLNATIARIFPEIIPIKITAIVRKYQASPPPKVHIVSNPEWNHTRKTNTYVIGSTQKELEEFLKTLYTPPHVKDIIPLPTTQSPS